MHQFLNACFPLSGIYNVGKAAVNKPALVYLSHKPAGAEKTVAWVGKGIVYDTGGLCIKTKVSQCALLMLYSISGVSVLY